MAGPRYGAGQGRKKPSTAQQNKQKRKAYQVQKRSSSKKLQGNKRELSNSGSLDDVPAQPRAKKLKVSPPTESYNHVSNAPKSSDSRMPGGENQTGDLDRHNDARTELGLSENQDPNPSDLSPVHQQVAGPSSPIGSPVDPSLEITPSEQSFDQNSIPFGTFVSLKDPSLLVHFRGSADGSTTTHVLGGHGVCDLVVPGAGKRQCLLVLELQRSPTLPLRRSVEIRRIDSRDRRMLITTGGLTSPFGESVSLSNGDRVTFGHENWYEYRAPKISELYRGQVAIHGFNLRDPNSRVSRAVRLSDGMELVVKTILPKCERWARTEVAALKTIGCHRNVVQLVEAFFDRSTSEHHIVFEPADTDLFKHVRKMRSENPSALAGQRTRIIAELSSAVAHLHSLNIAHRDIKPQNVLISFVGKRKVTAKLCDFGLVRLDTQPISGSGWRAGTLHWTAPRSFMVYPVDDRLVDCYGVGRILHFTLTASQWPDESKNPGDICGCPRICQGTCAIREQGFKELEKAKVGKHCLSLLRGLLVAIPKQCMEISQVLKHPYIESAVRKLD
ncbi:Serine/threonine-protein kinase/endoribonuclease IRE1 [Tulasnella sp. 427]|nr:Serine/threonine-protein kinase/endoribonuclease IRE1 [Tulasnella sp. 427]